ncbi:MAG: IcmT/TraK family protein [Deltaproteobacteria bacterium]|nr:IcmT/TraK family protein [Deltaproteobacteria bacterium]
MREDYEIYSFSAIRPKFFFLDARAIFPLGLFLLHWSILTFAIALVSILILLILDRFGLPVNVALLYLRSFLAGTIRPALETSLIRRRCQY